jgi:hypothetical protein
MQSALAQTGQDRSRIPLPQALAGHWLVKQYDKHEYYEITRGAPVVMTWDAKGGKEVIPSPTANPYRMVDEKKGIVILTHRSDDGLSNYITKFSFSPDRNAIMEQSLDGNLRPQGEPYILTYVGAETRSPYVK